MPFEKGNTHGNGRPKGSENKETKKLREWVGQLLDDNMELVAQDLKALNPKDRVTAVTNLLEYALPKLQRTEHDTGENGNITIIFGSGKRPEDTPSEP